MSAVSATNSPEMTSMLHLLPAPRASLCATASIATLAGRRSLCPCVSKIRARRDSPTHLRSNRMELALAVPRHVMTPGIATPRPDLDHVDELAEAMVMALAR